MRIAIDRAGHCYGSGRGCVGGDRYHGACTFDVRLEPAEQQTELLELLIGETCAQLPIEVGSRLAEALKHRIAAVRQFDSHDPAITWIAVTADQARRFEVVEMPRHRGALDSDRACEVVLGPPWRTFERHQVQPHR